ncbi:MAG: ligase-associated DNA damage response endonuclease PdeM [Cytophaga sp.]|uniref:ligase-associated DNA damage response endonuclease PdeM n=1 Tax=Cytophaga sp. TaxID=29535 RepID=UPI003F7CE04A
MSGQLLTIHEQIFELLPQKAMYWRDAQTLIISDLHLGKASHFRKNGMAIPMDSAMEDLQQLDFLLNTYSPKRLLILGDLFHSEYNQEWELFGALRRKYASIVFQLVRGNHDILKDHHYEKYDIEMHANTLHEHDFIFSHDKVAVKEKQFCITGHIHPGFVLSGKGRQSITLPCFYKKKNTLVMPAFGWLTGLAHMPYDKTAEVFVLTEEAVHRI